ncbi:MAG: hypothetical protein HZC42_08195 [Candidatus Eisenbacteria bacterium]|nr:hypothetical protein [Candidatus Eisenbacteria bacterium]
MARTIRLLVVAVLIPSLLLVGCAPSLQHGLLWPNQLHEVSEKSTYLNAHLRDGSFIALVAWTVDPAGRTVTGVGQRLDENRRLVASGSLSFPVDSVALFESNSTEGMPPAMKALTVILVSAAVVVGMGLLIIAIACVSNPKCFGSCPTFYVTDGEKPALQAEGFSASVAPALEATDVDALYRARPRGRDLEVTMKNEALETHVVRFVHVLAAPRAEGTRVFATPEGAFWQADRLRSPLRATGAEGDCGAALAAFDGTERTSAVDSTDLAARETVDLEFDAGAGEDPGLVIASRQTLLTTYLFYETLAAMGSSAGRWIAALGRGDAGARDRTSALGRELGGIEVLVPDGDGGWSRVCELNETGPLATDVKLVPLPKPGPGPVHIRLRMTRGLFRLDWAALARLDRRVEPVRLEPVAVRRGDTLDAGSRQALLDPARVLVTQPGDVFTLAYRLPGEAAGYELFLESRGYYLEWMREGWIAQEDPGRLMTMMLAPRQALRDLAPAYAREQAALEDWFWKSRYAHP